MLDLLIDKLHDVRFLTMLFAAVAASATAYALISPMFVSDGLTRRMKAVANERERIRQRERDRMSRNEKVTLRQSPKQFVGKIVHDFNLGKWLAQEEAKDKLVMPATLRVTFADGTSKDVRLPAETWIRQAATAVPVGGTSKVVSAVLDPDHRIPDRDRTNNSFAAK